MFFQIRCFRFNNSSHGFKKSTHIFYITKKTLKFFLFFYQVIPILDYYHEFHKKKINTAPQQAWTPMLVYITKMP
jgi:hypothetical protein